MITVYYDSFLHFFAIFISKEKLKNIFYLLKNKLENISITLACCNHIKYLKYKSKEEIKWMRKAIPIIIRCSFILEQKQPYKSIINALFMKDDTILIIEGVIIMETPTARAS